MTLAIGLVILAFALVALEMSFPSFGLLGLGAATAYAFALVTAFGEGTATGWSFVVAGIALLPIAIASGLRFLPYSPLGKRLLLKGPGADAIQQGTRQVDEERSLLHHEGVALSDLRPAGFAKIDGRRIDVVAEGGFVGEGERVRVIHTDGARVVVTSRPAPPTT